MAKKQLTFDQLKKGLKSKDYLPVYFLTGDEPYYIDSISDFIEHHVLDESERDFNQTVLYGIDINVEHILENAKRFPMMAERQVVIIKEAQNLKDAKNIGLLESYIKNPLESTMLVICYKYKNIDLRTSFGKTLNDSGFLFKSEKTKDYKLAEWISNFVVSKGYKINPRNAALIADHIGNDLNRIVNELSKTFVNLEKGAEITANVIERNIGVSKDFNNFELCNAIAERDHLKYNKIINFFSKNERDHPMLVTVGVLYGFFAKLLVYHYTKDKSSRNIATTLRVHEYFVKDYQNAARNYSARKVLQVISLLREYDARSKGIMNSGASNPELMKELAYKIAH